MIRTTVQQAVLCLLAALLCLPAMGAAEKAEYSIKWVDGGPKSGKEALSKAELPETDKPKSYVIQYYKLDAPKSAPAGFERIGRTRQRIGGKFELTFKYRGANPYPGEPGQKRIWVCPLPEPKDDGKYEIDISSQSDGTFRKQYSLSCESEDPKSREFPAELKAVKMPCEIQMTRLTSGAFRLEEWRLPGQATLFELSMQGEDTDQERAKFEAKAKSLQIPLKNVTNQSKYEAGSCK